MSFGLKQSSSRFDKARALNRECTCRLIAATGRFLYDRNPANLNFSSFDTKLNDSRLMSTEKEKRYLSSRAVWVAQSRAGKGRNLDPIMFASSF